MKLKPLEWIGSSKRDLKAFPKEIIENVGYSLFVAQKGEKPLNAKVLKGFGGANVIEIIESDDSGTYRVVYTVKFEDSIYVLHAFQKKSKHGIKTPKEEMDLVATRLKMAQQISKSKKER